MKHRFTVVERAVARGLTVAALSASILFTAASGAVAQHAGHGATPEATWSCAMAGTPVAAGHEDMGMDMDMAEVEFDQLYIDMMLPHHGSIIALAEAALPELTDPRLREMAQNIIQAQTAENAQLTEWRTAWYGSGEPVVTDASMERMLEAMPVGTMDEMMREMDAAYQVATFCASDDPDLAFIEQTIPHHQMAIDASEIAVEEAVHPELVALVEDVIVAQQAEIETLAEIRAELVGEATPAA
ncbi:MAG: DUF305 domain-containing protein [Chloroflexota bacterium]|nr:DUF305 domain-containing protein [Chloroflexota bacterium]